MDSQDYPSLSKSRFTAGLQCLKRLYLQSYQPDLADAVDAGTQARFDTGNEVGELARQRFPGGRLVAEPYYRHSLAVATTNTLLGTDPALPLYEAAFAFQGIRARADILRQSSPGAFDLIEVKSTTSAKPEHIPDVAIQLYALEGAGLPINRAFLMHLNNRYVYRGGDYDLEELFTPQDVTEEARRFVSDTVPGELLAMWEVLRQDEVPDIATGGHCKRPYQCPFYGHCHPEELEPPDTDPAKAWVGPDLASRLAELEHPVSFLDFETIGRPFRYTWGPAPTRRFPSSGRSTFRTRMGSWPTGSS